MDVVLGVVGMVMVVGGGCNKYCNLCGGYWEGGVD